MLLESIKNSFKVLLESVKNAAKSVAYNPSLVLFPVLYIILLNILLVLGAKSKIVAVSLIFFVCAFLFTAAWTSGWFGMIKKSFVNPQNTQKQPQLPIFFENVGKNIISVGLGLVLYMALAALGAVIITALATKIFGSLDFVIRDLQAAKETGITMAQYFKTLPTDKMYIIYGWQILFVLSYFIFNFLMTFFFPALMDETDENVYLKPFIAIKNSIVFVFRNFLAICACYIVSLFISSALSIVENIKFSNIVSINSIISVILFLIHLYFGVFMIVLIFNYYENNRHNRGNCIGENGSCN